MVKEAREVHGKRGKRGSWFMGKAALAPAFAMNHER
jgi:hypothetical protein